MLGIGFTVIVKNVDVPVQVTPALVKTGVTVIVAVIGTKEVFVAVNEAIFPDPLTARPMEVFEFTQLKTVPGTFPENDTTEVCALWHKTWLLTELAVGTGFTVTFITVGAIASHPFGSV